MGTRAVVYWEGPGEYTPVLTARPGWAVWCRALNALAAVTLNNEAHAARLGRVVWMR